MPRGKIKNRVSDSKSRLLRCYKGILFDIDLSDKLTEEEMAEIIINSLVDNL